MSELIEIHVRFREHSSSQGLSQKQVAEHLNVSRSTVNRIFTGKRPPTLEQLKSLAQLYGIELEQLVAGTDAKVIVDAEQVHPTQDELRDALTEVAQARAEVVQLREELEAERQHIRKLVAERDDAVEERDQARSERDRFKQEVAELRGGVKLIKADRDKWLFEVWAQKTTIVGLKKANTDQARKLANMRTKLQRVWASYQQLDQHYNELEEYSRQLEKGRRAALKRAADSVHPGAAVLAGVLGLALGGGLVAASSK